MASDKTSIARAIPLVLTFNPVAVGQNFTGIAEEHLRLTFNRMKIGVAYKVAVDLAAYFITPLTVEGTIHWRSGIVEASYTILTSRTSPAEPQPFDSSRMPRVGRGIPQVIV